MTTIDHNDSRPLYPVEQSFVVALRRDSQSFPEKCAGRIEHLVSGHSINFEHLPELLDFIAMHLGASARKDGSGEGESGK